VPSLASDRNKPKLIPQVAEDFTWIGSNRQKFRVDPFQESKQVALRINTNVSAMHALRHLGQTDRDTDKSITRLSTGLRINTAADDPAGLIISEGMRAHLKGLGQAIRNSQDAINMAKTAEGALDEVQRLLREVRGLTVHSANSAIVDANTLQANQTQIRSTIQSINRIAEQTQFGSKKLLDGTAGAMANVTATNFVSSLYVGGTFAGSGIQNGPVSVARVTQGTRAANTLGKGFASATAIVTTAGSFVINGYTISSNGNETVQSLVAKINEISSTTGVVAQVSGTGPVTVVLSQTTYGSQHNIQFFDPQNVLHNANSASSVGVDAVFNVTATTESGVQTVPFTGGRGPKESGLKLTDAFGNTLVLSEQGNATITTIAQQVGVVTAGSVRFQIGAHSEQSVSFSMPVVFANKLGAGIVTGKTLADVDVTTPQGAQDAMKIIDAAVNQLARLRGELGSFQKNFLESTVRSLDIANENLTSSESYIRDADMAAEITQYTKLQILKQSGMSVLAQANQAPQSVLSLLRGS
jgi:flagellin